MQISNELKQRKLGEEATKGQDDVRAVHKVRRIDTPNVFARLTSRAGTRERYYDSAF